LPLDSMMVLVSGQRFPHYFISLLPLCALAVAWLIERAERGWGRRPVLTRRVVRGLAVVVAVVTLVKTPHNLIRPVYSMRGRIEHEAADSLRRMASPDDLLLVWGMAPEVYVYSGLNPVGKYTHIYPLLSPGYTDEVVIQEFLDQVYAHPPALILDASSHNGRVPPLLEWDTGFRLFDAPLHPELERFYDYFQENYRSVSFLDGWEWTIYRRVETPLSAAD
jgi:hypothetical protein